MDRRIGFMEAELNRLNSTAQSAWVLFQQWKQNEQDGVSPAMPAQSIGTMKTYVNGMRRDLDTIDEILDSGG
jgi:hypothetical protein